MTNVIDNVEPTGSPAVRGAAGRPVLIADWVDAVFLHAACDPGILKEALPPDLQVDLLDGLAIVSLVAFTQRRLRPAAGGRLAAWLARPLANHEYLNLRAYVRWQGEAGIVFLAEWIPNRLAAFLGPRLYGLPYRLGRLEYERRGAAWRGTVASREDGRLEFAAVSVAGRFAPAAPGSPAEFLLERYAAFTWRRGVLRRFRVAHAPWPQALARARLGATSLLAGSGLCGKAARWFGAHVSPGVEGVRIGPPERLAAAGVRRRDGPLARRAR